MFAFVALLAFAASFLVRADVSPSEPAPGDVFNEGSPCAVSWAGDPDSTTLWKGMAIELMAGSNFQMEHLTTIATNQDGTVSGSFTFTCPAVIPNSAIYFYQFSSPNTPNMTWTGRFTIASTTGQSTPPANNLQPGTTQAIPWGNASLADPSIAVAAPSFDSGSSISLSSTSNLNSSVPIATSSGTGATTGIATITNIVTNSTSAAPSSTNSPSPNGQPSSGASGAMSGFDIRILGAAAAATLALSLVS